MICWSRHRLCRSRGHISATCKKSSTALSRRAASGVSGRGGCVPLHGGSCWITQRAPAAHADPAAQRCRWQADWWWRSGHCGRSSACPALRQRRRSTSFRRRTIHVDDEAGPARDRDKDGVLIIDGPSNLCCYIPACRWLARQGVAPRALLSTRRLLRAPSPRLRLQARARRGRRRQLPPLPLRLWPALLLTLR